VKWVLALAWVTVVLVALARVAGSAERTLTLDEAVSMALQRNETLTIERESAAAARAVLGAAEGAYDPVFAIDGGWRRSIEPVNSSFSGAPVGGFAPVNASAGGDASLEQLLPSGGLLALRSSATRTTTDGIFAPLTPAYGAQVGVELRQPLLRGLSTDQARFNVRAATADRLGAGASLRRVTSETVAATERAYWRLVAARLAIEVREEAVRLAQNQLEETRIRAERGAVPHTEVAQPQAELERRRGDLLETREAEARAENQLKALILGAADDSLWLATLVPSQDTTVDVTPIHVAAEIDRALTARPELEMAQAAVIRRRAETSYAHNGVLPSLDAVVSYDRYGLAGTGNTAAIDGVPPGLSGDLGTSFHTIGDGSFDATRVALTLSLPIVNRTARGNAAAADHQQRQAEADAARVRTLIRTEVLDAAAALETAGQRIEAARSGRAAAEVQLAAERDRYATGLSTNFLVLTRQNDLSRARLDEISAITDYRTARTEMARAAGSLLEERGIHVDGSGRQEVER
jgi:outer membrane protein TolC